MSENKSGARCKKCGKPLHRVPQMPMVNWNGLPPHEADRRPKFANDWIKNADKNRDTYKKRKEKHDGQG